MSEVGDLAVAFLAALGQLGSAPMHSKGTAEIC